MTKSGLVLFLVLLIFQCCCQMNEKPSQIDTQDIRYFRDPRTGVCFAAMNSRGSDMYLHTTISYVPCEPVEKLLDK